MINVMSSRAGILVEPNFGAEVSSDVTSSSGPVKLEDLQRILSNIDPAGIKFSPYIIHLYISLFSHFVELLYLLSLLVSSADTALDPDEGEIMIFYRWCCFKWTQMPYIQTFVI